MNYKNKKKLFNVALVFALIFSLFAPFQSVSKAADAITVAEAIANNTGTATVEGYIVGTTGNGPVYKQSGPFDVPSNIAIADSPTETDKSKIMPVQLASGSAVRAALNLVDNPSNLGKKVQITGTLAAYFSVPGLKSPSAYTFVEATAPTKVSDVTATPASGAVSVGDLVTLETTTTGAKIYYTTDGTEPTNASSEYTTPILVDKAMEIKALAIADGLENSDVATFTYTILTEKTIAEVRAINPVSKPNVMTSGTVTAVFGKTVYFQDATAGIVLYGSANVPVQVGDMISVKGKLTDFNSLLEIEANIADVQIQSNGQAPAAEEVKAADLQESKEAKLLKIKNVTIESFDKGNFTAKDADGTSFQIRPSDSSLLEVGTTYEEITGVLGAFKDVYQLLPRDIEDIIQDSSKAIPVVATPGTGFVNAGDTVTLTTRTAGATIHYTTDGSVPTISSSEYQAPIVINSDTTIKAIAVKDGLSNSDVATFEYFIQNGPIRIHDIQGARHFSVLDGKNVTDVEGVVTYVDSSSKFYMQDLNPDDDLKTSEGILVFKSGHNLSVGDVVKVTGKVVEFYGDGYDEKTQTDLPSTQIEASAITASEPKTAPLPAPIVIGVDRVAPTEIIDNDAMATFDPEEDGLDFWESMEGMYVQIDNAKVIAPQKYADVWVVPGNVATNTDAGGLKIAANDYNPEKVSLDFNDEGFLAKTGDSFNGSIKGVVSYGYSNFKILTKKADLPPFVTGSLQREVTPITKDENKLTIASYNVENFASTADDAKVTKLAQAIVTNMKTPDIIGLLEVQDNDGATNNGNVDASLSAKLLIDKIKSLGGPDYLFTDIAPVNNEDGGQPGGNIRVAFIYNKDRVSLTQGAPKGTATQSVGFDNGKLTLNPGRIDPTNVAFEDSRKPLAAQFEFKGKSVIVVANHFNSKGGDQPLFGKNQPPFLKSEIQRLQIAGVVNNFVKDVKAKDQNANVVLLGDFNDFEFTPALEKVKGNELISMIEKVPAAERYSYSYQGNAQVLDHILVSKNMEAHTIVDMLHINSSFMEEHGRASDHDPVIIQTELQEIPLGPVKVFNLVGFNTKKLTVANSNAEVTVNATSVIRQGIVLKGALAKLSGEGLKNTTVIISPARSGAVIDLSGVEVKEVVIDNANVSEIRGAEKVKAWKVSPGVNTSGITFKNAAGEVIPSPLNN